MSFYMRAAFWNRKLKVEVFWNEKLELKLRRFWGKGLLEIRLLEKISCHQYISLKILDSSNIFYILGEILPSLIYYLKNNEDLLPIFFKLL